MDVVGFVGSPFFPHDSSMTRNRILLIIPLVNWEWDVASTGLMSVFDSVSDVFHQ